MIQVNASALSRVMACNGSVAMAGFAPAINDDEISEDRREGTAAHHVAMSVLGGEIAEPLEYVDRRMPNGVYVTPEMSEYVEPFVTAIQSRGVIWEHEQTLDFNLSDTVYVAVRPDVMGYDPATGTLYADELKYGWRNVDVVANFQMIAGAYGYMLQRGIIPNRFVFTVHQPRPYHEDGKVREWSIEYEEFQTYVDLMRRELYEISDHLQTGPHCYECPALATCRAARMANMNAIDTASRVFNDDLPNDVLAFELDNISRAEDMMKQRKQALQELAKFRLREGGNVIGDYGLEMGLGNRKFTLDAAMIKAMTGFDPTDTTPQLLTPAKFEKDFKVDEETMKAITTRPVKGVQLIRKSASKRAGKLFKG